MEKEQKFIFLFLTDLAKGKKYKQNVTTASEY